MYVCERRGSMIAAAFKTFDRDSDGFVTIDEMKEVLTASGSTMSSDDVGELMGLFDKDLDGKLNLNEFTDAWGMFGSFLAETTSNWGAAQVAKTNQLYEQCVQPCAKAIKSIFQKLDSNGDGLLSVSELREVLVVYQGEAFDEGTFFRWHDIHGRERHRGSGGQVDEHEFGW